MGVAVDEVKRDHRREQRRQLGARVPEDRERRRRAEARDTRGADGQSRDRWRRVARDEIFVATSATTTALVFPRLAGGNVGRAASSGTRRREKRRAGSGTVLVAYDTKRQEILVPN